jgi:anaerobic magnesium-protoporphyrin IX monomethyl ester cyclase
VLVLLTHANHLYSDRKQVRKMQPYPPLQTLIAAAALRREGHSVLFADTTFDRDLSSHIRKRRPDLIAVCEDNFNFLTKMCLLQNRSFAFEIAALAKAEGVQAIVNSSDATDNPALYLEAGFDAVIVGELEATLLDVCRSGFQVAGTAFRNSAGAVCYGPPRRLIEDLDLLPPPAWDLLDADSYRRAWVDAHGFFCLNLVASRGCPYRCNWCAKPVYGAAYRHVTPLRAAQEMAHVKNALHPERLWFADDIFGLSAAWTREFARAVEDLDARIPFKMQSRCDLMTRDTVAALRRAGCDEVWMGVESGSQRILDAMEKGIRVEHIYQARENLRRHGIRACYFLQFGYLGETWEDIERTIQLVRETRPDDIGVSVSYPLPGTRFYHIVSSQLGRESHWKQSGDLTLMYSGTFPSEFYRALAAALHLEVGPAAPPDQLRSAWEEVEELRCACC